MKEVDPSLIHAINRLAGVDWVCPMPNQWNALWKMLSDRSRKGGGWEPPLPLILAAWWESSPIAKKDRFLEHLSWAKEHGRLPEVMEMLKSLEFESWYRGE